MPDSPTATTAGHTTDRDPRSLTLRRQKFVEAYVEIGAGDGGGGEAGAFDGEAC